MRATAPRDAGGTPTPSLRRRVVLTVLGLFAVLLGLVGLLVDLALRAQLRHDLDTRLDDRVAAARRLADAGTPPPQLVSLLQGQDIRVRVVTPDGAVYGDPGLGPPGPPPPAGPDPGAHPPPPVPGPPPDAPPTPPAATSTTVARALPDGSRLLLVADTTTITEVQDRLRGVMVVSALAALAVAALAVSGGVAAALRPLDRMTAVARRITAGDRGARIGPDRPGSELGRAAAAFDAALEALEDAEARAQRAADDIRRFLADAAHELRTPLAGVQAVAESLLVAPADAVDTERTQRRARLLVRETGRAARLVADLLDLARAEDGLPLQCTEVDVAELAAAEVERAGELAPRLTVALHAPAAAVVVADAGRLSQILVNLLDNARRHTPDGGTVTVSVATTAGGAVAVTVTDTGPGVAAADRERVFDRLVRLDPSRDRDSGGAGLGLPLARTLARAHGGELVAEPATAGARFRLTLPRAGPHAAATGSTPV